MNLPCISSDFCLSRRIPKCFGGLRMIPRALYGLFTSDLKELLPLMQPLGPIVFGPNLGSRP